MTVKNVPAAGPQAVPETAAPVLARQSRPWLLAAFLLAGAAQLITIAALTSADPLAVTWSSLLLAIAPAPLVAMVAFGPAPVARPAAVAAVAVLVAGIAGGVLHTGLFFAPALVVLLIGAASRWRERA
jgi:hypothetical protein